MLAAVTCLSLLAGSLPESDPSTWTPPPMVEASEDAIPEVPGPEVGLMITESLFGMVTAAGVSLIPYFLLKLVPGTFGITDPTLQGLILILTFSGVPLAVSQTEFSIAQSSRFYDVEGWPAPLAGLLAQVGVFFFYFHLRGDPTVDAFTTEALLLGGTIAAVPVVEMAAMNLLKFPRKQKPVAMLTTGRAGVVVSAPTLQPVLRASPSGRVELGLHVPVLAGSF